MSPATPAALREQAVAMWSPRNRDEASRQQRDTARALRKRMHGAATVAQLRALESRMLKHHRLGTISDRHLACLDSLLVDRLLDIEEAQA